MTSRAFALALCVGSFWPAALADDAVDRRLIERVSAQHPDAPRNTASPAAAAARSGQTTDEQTARAEVSLAQARLELVLARHALAAGEALDAARHARAAEHHLAQLPTGIDAGDLELQVEGTLARAARAGVDVASVRAPLDASPALRASDVAVAQPAETPAGGTAEANPGDDPRPAEKRHRHARGSACERKPREIASDRYMRILVDRTSGDVVDDMTFPADWPQRTERRSHFRNGEIARGPSRTDASGRESFVAIYDISDLTYVPPDFVLPAGFHPWQDLQAALDRDALRNRSMIFGGYPEDFAAGLPLLHYLGGVDPFLMRGPKYSFARQQQVIEMVNAVLDENTQPRILVTPAPGGVNQP